MYRPEVRYRGTFSIDNEVHTPAALLSIVAQEADTYVKLKTSTFDKNGGKMKTKEYYNVPAAFDIETSSWNEGDKHMACLTCWQYGINGHACIGRTYEELMDFRTKLAEILGLGNGTYIILYVHNNSYEFQWLRKRLNFTDVFSMKERDVIRCRTEIEEWRDSYVLTGCSLAAVKLEKYNVAKQIDSWDYRLIRHTSTELSEAEQRYALFDVLVVMGVIKEKMELDADDITKIPLTRTGYVRNDCRIHTVDCEDKKQAKLYRDLMKTLTLTDAEYKQLKQTFMGGFTHACYRYSGKVIENVGSFDFTSSYPAVMICEQFPRGRAEIEPPKTIEELHELNNRYCTVFKMTITNVRPKNTYDHIISQSRCVCLEGKSQFSKEISEFLCSDETVCESNLASMVEDPYDTDDATLLLDNGRVVKAEKLSIFVTNVDYEMINKFYEYDSISISNFIAYYKAYLPKQLIERILHYYQKKTTLKDIEEAKVQYNLNKEMINCIYGMFVMDIVRPEVVYDEASEKVFESVTESIQVESSYEYESQVQKYNKRRSRFTYYPDGIFVTAYARRNLLNGILACGDNYIYSDTDSIKYVLEDSEHFLKYVEEYNAEVEQKMLAVCAHFGLDPDSWRPKNKKGVPKPLGYWDEETPYTRFKTVGAKRYIGESWEFNKKTGAKELKIKTTVAGCNKGKLPGYLKSLGGDPFDWFNTNLVIPANESGKLAHHYMDMEIRTEVTDHNGVTGPVHELSYVNLEDIPFTMSIGAEYQDYLGLVEACTHPFSENYMM